MSLEISKMIKIQGVPKLFVQNFVPPFFQFFTHCFIVFLSFKMKLPTELREAMLRMHKFKNTKQEKLQRPFG